MKQHILTNDFMNYWLETVMRDMLRKTSYATYRGYIKNHIEPVIGNEFVNDVTLQDIQGIIKTLYKKRLSAKTIHLIMNMMRTAFECAVDYDLMEKNPCRKMKLPKFKHNNKIQIFSKEEIKKIETTALLGRDERYLGVLISLYTGLRIGEICALKYTDIDIENKLLYVNHSIKRVLNYEEGKSKSSVIEEEPKTENSRRSIPIPEKICKIIKKRFLSHCSEYIVSMPSGKYCEPRTFQFVYERLLDDANVTYRNHHCCRHTFVTHCIELGGDIKTISELVGHSSVSITLSVYTHCQMETKKRLIDKLNNEIFDTSNDTY